MEKYDVYKKIESSGLVAVIRARNQQEALKITEASLNGGVGAIEITFTVPNAHEVISKLASEFAGANILIGAGTVLDSETARIAILSGASFIVSPCLNISTIKLCNRYAIPYIPGAMTVKEALEAMELGADIIKVFPGEISGPKIIKAFKGPLPYGKFMPTGGVNLDNVAEWIAAGAVAVGVGGSLTKSASTGNYSAITEIAEKYIEKIKEARLLLY
ncbi:MAG: ketohydroxyglutarate aldolase [Clostridia bacterium BRH_c25]|nr:MAG: ketohydroxyglutarate aldolase [Clostridia bacterium BRH_c25]